ncbi:MAG: hypothetical protein ACYTHJ_01045 [Planctomycetota bacterium]
MSDNPEVGPAPSNVYTILVMMAALFVMGATIYLAVRHNQLFGTWNPLP